MCEPVIPVRSSTFINTLKITVRSFISFLFRDYNKDNRFKVKSLNFYSERYWILLQNKYKFKLMSQRFFNKKSYRS